MRLLCCMPCNMRAGCTACLATAQGCCVRRLVSHPLDDLSSSSASSAAGSLPGSPLASAAAAPLAWQDKPVKQGPAAQDEPPADALSTAPDAVEAALLPALAAVAQQQNLSSSIQEQLERAAISISPRGPLLQAMWQQALEAEAQLQQALPEAPSAAKPEQPASLAQPTDSPVSPSPGSSGAQHKKPQPESAAPVSSLNPAALQDADAVQLAACNSGLGSGDSAAAMQMQNGTLAGETEAAQQDSQPCTAQQAGKSSSLKRFVLRLSCMSGEACLHAACCSICATQHAACCDLLVLLQADAAADQWQTRTAARASALLPGMSHSADSI